MRRIFACPLLLCLAFGLSGTQGLDAQETQSGLDFRATVTAQAVASNELTQVPRSGSPIIIGSRSVVYPTLKINDNWFVTGALQLATRPYFFDELSDPGYEAEAAALQFTLNYSRIFRNGSILMRAGEMSTAFGSFMLHYDDAENALVDLPVEYGYYGSPVSTSGIAAVQADVTRGKWDARAQFANSSPANPRSLFARDEYGNWAGGTGYTIRQGLRIGVSGYRGPYLDRKNHYFFPGEANPSKLPATAVSLEVNLAHGHTSAQGEMQHFVMPYHAIPTFRESAGYGELKQALSPRWYVALRTGFSKSTASGNVQVFETSAGYRPNRLQLIKIGYEYTKYSTGTEWNDSTLGIQFITTLHRSVWGK